MPNPVNEGAIEASLEASDDGLQTAINPNPQILEVSTPAGAVPISTPSGTGPALASSAPPGPGADDPSVHETVTFPEGFNVNKAIEAPATKVKGGFEAFSAY